LLATRQFEDAKTRAEKALAKDPKNVEAQVILGNALSGLNNVPEAIKELEEAIQLDPKSTAAYTSLGAIEVARGRQPAAEEAFRKAVEMNPTSPIAHVALATFLVTTSRASEAEAPLKKALEFEPGNPMATRALAALYMSTRRHAEAEPYLKSLAEADKTPAASAKLALADYYIGMNRIDDGIKVLEALKNTPGARTAASTRIAAIAYSRNGAAVGNKGIDEVLTRDPKSVPALLTKTQFLISEGKLDAALVKAQAAAAADPRSLQAHYLIGTIQQRLNKRPEALAAFNEVLKLNPRATAAQLRVAQLNLARGQAETALQMAREVAKVAPRSPAVQLTLGRTLLANRQTPEAERVARDLIAAQPKLAAAHMLGGAVWAAKRDFAASRKAYDKAHELAPLDMEPVAGLVALDLAEKKTDDATKRVEALLAISPTRLEAYMLGAQVYARTRKFDQVEATLKRAIEAYPDALGPYALLGQLYTAQKRLGEARANFERVIERQPNSVAAHTIVAVLYEMEGNSVEARKRYERVLKIDGTALVAANNLAYRYAEEGGNLDVALQLAQTAKQKMPDLPEVTDTVGWVYYKKDLPALAIPMFEQALAKAPTNPIYRYHLGLAHLKTGDRAKARAAFESVMKNSPGAPEAEEARKALASM